MRKRDAKTCVLSMHPARSVALISGHPFSACIALLDAPVWTHPECVSPLSFCEIECEYQEI